MLHLKLYFSRWGILKSRECPDCIERTYPCFKGNWSIFQPPLFSPIEGLNYREKLSQIHTWEDHLILELRIQHHPQQLSDLWSNSNKLINLDKCLWTWQVIVHQQVVRSNLSWLTAQEKERNRLCFPAALLFCRWCFSDFSRLNIETSISTNGRTTPMGFYKRQKFVLIVYLRILPECLSPASPEHHVFCDTVWQCLST